MSVFIRVGLAVMFLEELMIGAWNTIAPESFYRLFPTVDLTPPFSEHYARDFGGASLGLALLLGWALVRPRTDFVVAATLAYLMFAVPHFVYHLHHLAGASTGEAIFLTGANGGIALLGIAVVLAASRQRNKEIRDVA